MNRLRKQINALLKTHGANLVRVKKHRVFKLPGGKTYVEANTPSTQDADQKELAKLKRILEIPRDTSPRLVRAQKSRTAPNSRPIKETLIKGNSQSLSFGEKLASERVKLFEDELLMSQEHIEVLNAQVIDLEGQIIEQTTATKLAREYIRRLEKKTCACWWCRIRIYCRFLPRERTSSRTNSGL